MKDQFYHLIASAVDLFLWSGELLGQENLPGKGPAVFIGNHLDAAGPIGVACSLPLRVHPWIITDMMDRDLAPKYMQWDFIERQLHLKPPLSCWLASLLCRITVPLFHSLGCIPVYRHDYHRLHATLQATLQVLRTGEFVLIFPEDNQLPMDPVTRMQPFQHSFVRLAEMYHLETGLCLPFIPVATHGSGYVRLGPAVVYNPRSQVGVERCRIKDAIEDQVIRMYLEMDGRDQKQDLRALPIVR